MKAYFNPYLDDECICTKIMLFIKCVQVFLVELKLLDVFFFLFLRFFTNNFSCVDDLVLST